MCYLFMSKESVIVLFGDKIVMFLLQNGFEISVHGSTAILAAWDVEISHGLQLCMKDIISDIIGIGLWVWYMGFSCWQIKLFEIL